MFILSCLLFFLIIQSQKQQKVEPVVTGLKKIQAVETIGLKPYIEIRSTEQKGYQLYVNNKPFLIKGVIYHPIPIGEGYTCDFFSDKSKPWMIDGKLMQEAGINCIRIYSSGKDWEKVKQFIGDMYENFGIYTIVSDWIGLWEQPAPNYGDVEFREKIKKNILEMVQTLKNEQGILFWCLGNENNYTFSGKTRFWTSPEIEEIQDMKEKIDKKAGIYYSFIEDIAREIKKIDKLHPVALGNGEASFLNVASKLCPDIDLLAVIIYRGKNFGNLFNNIRNYYDKPIFLSEFGCDSYNAYKDQEDQENQKEFLLYQWDDLYHNTVQSGNSTGNVLGGALFEWTDEWWKHAEGYTQDWNVHNTGAGWSESSYYFDIRAKNNLNMNEEWFGIVGISQEKENGINKRIPKKSYYALKEYFNDPVNYNFTNSSPKPELKGRKPELNPTLSGDTEIKSEQEDVKPPL